MPLLSVFRRVVIVGMLLGALLELPASVDASSSLRSAVVKIHVTFQGEDYSIPWQAGVPSGGTGSGFVIEKRRILTNAHVVSNARFIQVQKDGDPRRYRARVAFSGADCDLAVLEVEEDGFFEGTSPARFSSALPQLSDEVTVMGYPMGGDRLSLTRGVVSRIDYSVYTHSGVDQHLVLQVDAAINPGNSGGPVLFRNRVVGLAFQGMVWADNIGYAIPVPVIRHFLDDIEDGSYNGYPELGVTFLDTRNPALRTHLKLPDDEAGIVISYVDPFGSAHGHILPGDVLRSIDGYPIANDGTIELDGNNVLFAELLERKQCGESITLTWIRDGAPLSRHIPLIDNNDPFIFRNLYDQRPRYLLHGGLVFSPLTREYLRTLDQRPAAAHVQHLFYYAAFAKQDGWHTGRDEFIVLTRRLPHEVNTYAEGYLNAVVTEVNGLPIRNLRDLNRAFQSPNKGFHVIRFADLDDALIMDAGAVARTDPEIRQRYAVPAPSRLENSP